MPQKETKATKAQLKMQATRCDAEKSEIDEQTKRQSDTAQLIERVRHRLARWPPRPLADRAFALRSSRRSTSAR